jgi:hypothetical protein
MLDFSGLNNTSGAFPNVEATDSSGPTLRDGTPITASLVNDIWGAFQAILNAAGTTPSATNETSTASDLLDSIRKIGGAPGEVVFHASPSDVIDANVLPLKGQVVTISAYPALVAATYVGDGNNAQTRFSAFYKCSDTGGATRNTAGPYFKLPDCRGNFIRALAGARTSVDAGRDYDTTTYGVDHRNMSGRSYPESPGWHIHAVENTAGQGIIEDLQYVMRSNPGNVTGSAGTVATFPAYVYKKQVATTELQTEIGKQVPGSEYGSLTYFAEVRPLHIAFHLGIRY